MPHCRTLRAVLTNVRAARDVVDRGPVLPYLDNAETAIRRALGVQS